MSKHFVTTAHQLKHEALTLWQHCQIVLATFVCKAERSLRESTEHSFRSAKRSYSECQKALRLAGAHPAMEDLEKNILAINQTVGSMTVRAEDLAAKCGIEN